MISEQLLGLREEGRSNISGSAETVRMASSAMCLCESSGGKDRGWRDRT